MNIPSIKHINGLILSTLLISPILPMYVVASAITTESDIATVNSDESTTLLRRARWQAKFKTETQENGTLGKKITQLDEQSGLALAGAKIDDVILTVNEQHIASNEHWYDLTDALVGQVNYRFQLLRGNKLINIDATFKPLAKEVHPKLTTDYQQIVSDHGITQRVIITRPKLKTELPAIFFIQGLSCSSIEILPHRQSNYVRLINDIVEKSNMVVLRVEKPGLGDSRGACSSTDFNTELAGYEAAIKHLAALPYVDNEKILIYGNSMGSAIAPYLANKYNANAVIADGTFYRSWFEHMLEIERRILAMKGNSQHQITQLMNKAYIPLYYGMLIEKKSYQDVIKQSPELAQYNYHGDNHMYGRPMSYYHQLQEFDVAGEWEKLSVPVKIRWGMNDWIMSEADNDMIIQTLKANGNQHAELYKYPGLDHWSTIHSSASHSFTGKQGQWENNISEQIIHWAQVLNK